MRRCPTLIALGVLLGLSLALGACGAGGSRTITLLVVRVPEGGAKHAEPPAGTPIEGAHVRASPLEVHPVAIPVSPETLRAADIAGGAGGFTDQHGVVRLRLGAGVPYLVQVDPPPMGPEAGLPPSWWRLDAEVDELTEAAGFRRSPGALVPVIARPTPD